MLLVKLSELNELWLDRALKRIDYRIDDNGCHICTSHNANQPGRYPVISISRKMITIRRLLYSLQYGEIPDDKRLMSTCDNCKCINPEHVTLEDIGAIIYIKTLPKCPRGSYHPNSKLTVQDVLDIRASDKSAPELASIYQVSDTLIYRIWSRDVWKGI